MLRMRGRVALYLTGMKYGTWERMAEQGFREGNKGGGV